MKTVRIRGRVGDGRTHSTDQARWLDQRLQLDLYDIIIHYIGKKSSEYAASSNTASTSFPPFCPVFFAAISWSAIMSTHLRTSRPIFRQLTSDPSEILWQLLLGSQRYPSGFLRTLSLSLSLLLRTLPELLDYFEHFCFVCLKIRSWTFERGTGGRGEGVRGDRDSFRFILWCLFFLF